MNNVFVALLVALTGFSAFAAEPVETQAPTDKVTVKCSCGEKGEYWIRANGTSGRMDRVPTFDLIGSVTLESTYSQEPKEIEKAALVLCREKYKKRYKNLKTAAVGSCRYK